jgi:hypothetical protein
MIISLYGERYIDSQEFVSYCRSIKADQILSSSDLELYEKERLLLPVARIIRPSEYMNLREAQFDPGGDPGVPISGWEELEKLLFGSNHEGLWHKFDREFDRHNRYLIDPSKMGYQPWDSYQAKVKNSTGEEYLKENAHHYYHYWQIYQAYEIQRKFPVFSKYHSVYEILKESRPAWADYFYPGTPNHLVDVYGYYSRFDALSFFMTLYAQEKVKTFLLPNGKIRPFDEKEIEDYRTRVKKHAQSVVNQFGLGDKIESLYEFLIYLLELQSDFQRQEKMLLAKEIEKDLINLITFIFFAIGQKFDDIGHALEQRIDLGTQKRFRHLDKSLLVKDETQDVFEHLVKKYNHLFPDSSLSNQELKQLVDFLIAKPLFIFPHAIYDIQENLNEGKYFPRTSLYSGLGNLSVGFESFLRTLVNGDSLYELIDNLYGKDLTQKDLWLKQFRRYVSKHTVVDPKNWRLPVGVEFTRKEVYDAQKAQKF